jgi:DNA repair exonuclease SbcCD ATPase subunit
LRKRHQGLQSRTQQLALEVRVQQALLKREQATAATLRTKLQATEKARRALAREKARLTSKKNKHALRAKEMRNALKQAKTRHQKLKRRSLVLQAQLAMMKRDAKRRAKRLKKWRKEAGLLRSKQMQQDARVALLGKQNTKLQQSLQKLQLLLERQKLHRKSERAHFRKQLRGMEKKEQKLATQNNHLRASQRQLSSAMKQLKVLGRLPGKEKAGLTKSMTRFLLAVFIYVKSDQVTGFRRFKDTQTTRFDRPISLSRRSASTNKLKYRGALDPAFSAFGRLNARLPAEIVSSREAIYIFVFDENCTKATTSGLELEHQTRFSSRRVIWQL